jgi:hypothetical protein
MAGRQGVQQRLRDRFLPNHISQGLGTPFTVKYLCSHDVYYTLKENKL